MLVATICLVVITFAQVIVAIFQARAAVRQATAAEEQAAVARRQAEAADRQVEAANRAIEVTRRQIKAAVELEDNRTRPWLTFNHGGYSTDSAVPLRFKNEGAGPAIDIAMGRHANQSVHLDPRTLFGLPNHSLAPGESFEVTVNIATFSTPMYVHCFSAQRSEYIYELTAGPGVRFNHRQAFKYPPAENS